MNEYDFEILHKNLPFWDKLTLSQRELLITNVNSAHFIKGQAIHCGGNECIGVLIIKNGAIRTYITSDEGREITLFRLGADDICILSSSCVLETIDFDVSVDAETDCDVLQISTPMFSQLSKENVYVELFSYQLTTERFSDVMCAMQQILFTSFDKRLAAFLLEESTKQNTTDIHMTHEQIAKYLGSAREVVSRMLKCFSQEGYVTLSRGDIHILDIQALKAIS